MLVTTRHTVTSLPPLRTLQLDLLWTRKQTVMYNIFDWPTRPQAKLIEIGRAHV